MAGQFIRSIKYGILAVIAFFGPKFLTESGNYFAKMERTFPPANESGSGGAPSDSFRKGDPAPSLFDGLLHPTEEKGKTGGEIFRPLAATSATVENPSYSARYPTSSESNDSKGAAAAARGIPITPLEKILRFDLTPDQIRETWPVVYVDRSLPGLTGFRVSAITGTATDDLAGALTFYFDSRHMNRISFSGRTGDTGRIVDFLGYRYGTVYQGAESTAETEVYRVPSDGWGKRGSELSRLVIRRGIAYNAERPDGGDEVTFDLYSSD